MISTELRRRAQDALEAIRHNRLPFPTYAPNPSELDRLRSDLTLLINAIEALLELVLEDDV